MNQFETHGVFEFNSFLNQPFESSAAAIESGESFPEISSLSNSSNFLSGNNMPLYETLGQWDLSSLSNIQPFPTHQLSPLNTTNLWAFNLQFDSPSDLTETPSRHDSWSPSTPPSPSSPNSDTESEKTTKPHSPLPENTQTPKDSGSSSPRKATKIKIDKADRVERRREKNRTSQRKYRERKEQHIQQLERQCRELQTRYDSLVQFLSNNGNLPKGKKELPDWQDPFEMTV